MALTNNEKISNKKSNGMEKLFIGIIITLILIVALIITLMIYLSSSVGTETKQSIYLNGAESEELNNMIVSQNDTYYVSLKQIARIGGYDAYNGDYIYVSEDANKCHVIVEKEEVIQFNANSNKASKIKSKENLAYAELTLEKPIISINNELHISIEDITNALYLYTASDEKGTIQIYTLDNMYSLYNNFVKDMDYTIPDTFTNKKAILNDMLICKNSQNKYAVINSKGETIIEPKYDNLEYIEETQDFIVTYNGVKGIIQNQKTKIAISYDEIKYIEYANVYAVTLNKKVGFFDVNGGQIIGFNFDEVGSNTSVKNARSVKYINTKGLLVVKANGKYGLIGKDGSTIVDFYLDDVYSTVLNGSLQYFVVNNGTVTNINSIV